MHVLGGWVESVDVHCLIELILRRGSWQTLLASLHPGATERRLGARIRRCGRYVVYCARIACHVEIAEPHGFHSYSGSQCWKASPSCTLGRPGDKEISS